MNCVPKSWVCYLDKILQKYSAKYVSINHSVKVKTNLELLKFSTSQKLTKLTENGMACSWCGTETTWHGCYEGNLIFHMLRMDFSFRRQYRSSFLYRTDYHWTRSEYIIVKKRVLLWQGNRQRCILSLTVLEYRLTQLTLKEVSNCECNFSNLPQYPIKRSKYLLGKSK